MLAYVSVSDDGRINCTTRSEEYRDPGDFEFTFPDDFNFLKQYEYRIVNGELIHDPPPEPIDIQIDRLKSSLAQTDYAVIKVYEAMVTGDELPEEDAQRYAEIIAQRKEWRSKINELEASAEGGE